MLFPTVTFAVFFMIVLPLSWLAMPRPARWRLLMVVASYVFYGWWNAPYVLLLGGSTLFNHVIANAIFRAQRAGDRRAARVLVWLGVAGNVGVLAYFKYWNFFAVSASDSLSALGVHAGPILVGSILPIGISFYTFVALSYVIDVYRRDIQPVSLSKFAVFVSFFPHLVAGPIVRASELIPQFDSPRDPRRVDATRAFALIGSGLFLKVVLATACSPIVDQVFGSPDVHSSLETWVAVYAYAVQIFADFAGYSTIAIGLALLLGFKFPDNFDNPYRATSLQDFWRRWHMTLSRWLRDYVYIPLGGSRHGERATYRNLMATMLIGGLWHGAGWTFVFWGGLHGVGLAAERWRASRLRAHGERARPGFARNPALAWLITFHLVCFLWVFFRATSFGNALAVFGHLFSAWGRPSPAVNLGLLAAIAVGIGVQFVPRGWWYAVQARFSRSPIVAQGVALAGVLMLISALGPRGVAPFIYFQF